MNQQKAAQRRAEKTQKMLEAAPLPAVPPNDGEQATGLRPVAGPTSVAVRATAASETAGLTREVARLFADAHDRVAKAQMEPAQPYRGLGVS